jgi:hypothetical protein
MSDIKATQYRDHKWYGLHVRVTGIHKYVSRDFTFVTPEHKWVIVRTAGRWQEIPGGGSQYVLEKGRVTVHGIRRSEAAAHAEASSLPGGYVLKVEEIS